MSFSRLVTTNLLFLALTTPTFAQDWPRFRGPNGSGVSTANIPAEWNKDDFHWKIKLPGKGHSSPVVWGKRIYVTGAEEKSGERFLACVSADNGKILWERRYGIFKQKYHQDSSPASASPAADEMGIYIPWGNAKEYLVIALHHEGKEIWRKDLGPCKMGYQPVEKLA